MNNIKKFIIILLMILLILIILLIFLLNLNDSSTEYPESDANSGPQDIMIELNNHIEEEKNNNKIFTISDYINQMLTYEGEENIEALQGLVEDYQEIENMNLEQKQSEFYAQEIYKQESMDKATYFTSGIVHITDTNYNESFNLIYLQINIDYQNQAWRAYVIDRETFDEIKQDTESTIENFEIERNEYNKFEQKTYSTEENCNRYISDFIIKLKYNKELAFEFVDEEYRKQKFEDSFERFNEYIENNQDRIYNLTIESYLKELNEDNIVYTVLDTYGNYYIIESSGGLDYTIKLDNFTIETEEFKSSYENATEQEKVTTNLSKIVKWVNTKDYLQIYNKLDSEFKQNNFQNIETFETYMQENFFDYNIIEIEKINKISDNYICDVILRSGNGLSAEETTKTFIMQLGEGTDFVMSFSV